MEVRARTTGGAVGTCKVGLAPSDTTTPCGKLNMARGHAMTPTLMAGEPRFLFRVPNASWRLRNISRDGATVRLRHERPRDAANEIRRWRSAAFVPAQEIYGESESKVLELFEASRQYRTVSSSQ